MPDPKKNSRFPRSCYAAGMTYDDIILAILHSAMKRYNLLLEAVREPASARNGKTAPLEGEAG